MKVVHLKKEKYDVRIDRASKFGNPFHIGKDGDRKTVIQKYQLWLSAPEQEELRKMVQRELKGKILGCWCAPLSCHGDILLELANK